jgi:hypothetical protein
VTALDRKASATHNRSWRARVILDYCRSRGSARRPRWDSTAVTEYKYSKHITVIATKTKNWRRRDLSYQASQFRQQQQPDAPALPDAFVAISESKQSQSFDSQSRHFQYCFPFLRINSSPIPVKFCRWVNGVVFYRNISKYMPDS